MAKDDFWDEFLKIGLILGSIWLGAEFLKNLSDKNKNGGNNGSAGTQPPNL